MGKFVYAYSKLGNELYSFLDLGEAQDGWVARGLAPLFLLFHGGTIRPGEPVGPIILTHHLLQTNPFARLPPSTSVSRRRLSLFLKHIQIW